MTSLHVLFFKGSSGISGVRSPYAIQTQGSRTETAEQVCVPLSKRT